MHRSVTLVSTIDPPWTSLPAVALGKSPPGIGTPVLFGLVECAGRPERRLDLYGEPGSETYFQSDAQPWHAWLAVGFGWRVYLVSAKDWSVKTLELPSYFQAFHLGSDSLLVVFGTGLMQVDEDGAVRWRNDGLAIDGVVIRSIADGLIRGEGEWDPPGGWRPFIVSLLSGSHVPGLRPGAQQRVARGRGASHVFVHAAAAANGPSPVNARVVRRLIRLDLRVADIPM